jgi:hypothetical protein
MNYAELRALARDRRDREIRAARQTYRPFSLAEIIAGLEAMDDRRDWQPSHVVSHLGRLRVLGIIRRLKRPKRGEPALYISSDAATEQGIEREEPTLKESIATILQAKRLMATEIVVLLLEGGYKTAMKPHKLRLVVAAVLRENPQLFTPSGDKWRLA